MADLRTRLLNTKKFKLRPVTVEAEEDGKPVSITVHVRTPSVSEAGRIGKAAQEDSVKGAILGVVLCAMNEDGTPIFQPEDQDALLAFPATSWVIRLGVEVIKISSDAETEAKN